MTDDARAQGGVICIGVVVAGVLFLVGLLRGSYLALAVPVAILTFFGLGLAFWVGWTIATVRIEPEPEPGDLPEASDATAERSDPGDA